jgi:hypothetical protein
MLYNIKIMKFWFQDPSKYQQTLNTSGISEDEYFNIVDVINRTFPKDWIDSELDKIEKKSNFMHCELWPSLIFGLRYNPIPMILKRTEGFIAFINIIRLGRLIIRAEKLPTKNGVIKKLKGNVDDYVSSLFELETLEFFSKSGFSLCGFPEDDGVDYTFEKNGQKIFVEVTHRGHSWVTELFSRLGESVTEGQNRKFNKCISINYKIAREFAMLNSIEQLAFDIDRELA